MKIIALACFTVALAIGLGACGKSSNSTPNGNSSPTLAGSPPGKLDPMAQAKLNYGDNCAICHKADGTGGRVTIKGETLKVPTFLSGHALTHSDQGYIDQINDGGDGMPQFKDKLTAEQIKDIVAYIRKAFQAGAAK